MTAPDARHSDELRGAILRVLCVEYESVADEEAPVADAILPVVTAWAEKQARARAAEELVVLASRLIAHDVEDPVVYEVIGALRDALAADDRTDPA